MPGVITCNTLGPVQVLLDGTAAPRELQWRKHLALLVYLARSPKRARTREHLIGLLWGDKPEENARRSLSVALELLRRFAGKRGITTDHGQVRLSPNVAHLDTERFEEAAARQDWGAAAALVAGEFLEGFAVPGAPEFEHWLTAERSLWRDRAVDALTRHADLLLSRGHATAAAEAARLAVRLDGTSEVAARAVMRALALAGDRAGALKAYAALGARLEDVGAAPSAELRALADRIRSERAWRHPPPVPAAKITERPPPYAPLIGREAALGRLLEVWAACRQTPRASLVVIAADPGMGKTRLLEELLSRARLDGATTVTARAVEADREAAWSGLAGLARGGLLEAPGLPAAPPAALAAIAELVPEWAERFAKAIRSGGAATEPPTRALGDVLKATAAEAALVLGCDDAHWLDRDSLLALGAVLRDMSRTPVFVVCTVSPEVPCPELDELRTRLGREIAGVAITLDALDATSLLALCRWACPKYDDAQLDRLARRIERDSAGLPLIAVELLRAVVLGFDLGPLRTGVWPESKHTLDQTLPGDLPDTIVSAVRITFRRLTPAAQTVLAAASVLPDRIESGLLSRKTSLPPPKVTAALDELEREGWLVFEGRGYTFRARVVRQVVARDMLTKGQRNRLLEED